jgi:hypothetical protein
MSSLTHPTKSNPLSKVNPAQAVVPLQIYSDGDTLPPSQRLVVILPDTNFDILSLPRRIWNMAAPEQRQVLLLARPVSAENENHLRLSLATLASLIRDPWISVHIQLVSGTSLEQAVCQCAQPGDLLVCFEKHLLPGFLRKAQLATSLAQSTHLPVYTLKGPVNELLPARNSRIVDGFLLLLCLAALIAFFFLDVWIDQNSAGTFRSVLLVCASIVEVWVIAACATHSINI